MKFSSRLYRLHFQIRLHNILEAHDFNSILGRHPLNTKGRSKNHGIHILIFLKQYGHPKIRKQSQWQSQLQ